MVSLQKLSLVSSIPENIGLENEINPNRIYIINDKQIKSGMIVYLMDREMRLEDNFALNYAIKLSFDMNKSLKIICRYEKSEVEGKERFISEQIENLRIDFIEQNLDFQIFQGTNEEILEVLKNMDIGLLITDFNPIVERDVFQGAPFRILEIDGHNVIPAKFISSKQEYSAATFRRKVVANLADFLKDFPKEFYSSSQSQKALASFVKYRLKNYNKFKNNPNVDALSNLSKYLNLGFISSQRVALEVIASDVDEETKEAYLEELIVRKELADNFCLYCDAYKTFECAPWWGVKTLKQHKTDFRQYLYDVNVFEKAKTHDKLWNAAQKQLIKEGKIHGYLRMYWAKKILEWTKTPQKAFEIAKYLNDKYAYDAPSSNGYVGILWAIVGLHDRAFKERDIIGKIRPMTYNGAKSKFNVCTYIKKFN